MQLSNLAEGYITEYNNHNRMDKCIVLIQHISLNLSEILNVITAQNGLIKLPNFCFDFFSDLMTMVERILRTQIQLH
jgi:hypothetical protein